MEVLLVRRSPDVGSVRSDPDVVVFMFRGRCCGVFVVVGFGLSQPLVIICRLLIT